MNEFITYSKSGVREIRNYEKSDVPFVLYPDMTKNRGAIFSVNKHRDIELLYLTAGKLKIHLDNEVFYAEKNNVVVVNSDVLHNIIPLTDSVTYDCIIINKNFFESHGLGLSNVHIKEIIRDEAVNKNISCIKEIMTIRKAKYYVAEVFLRLIDMSVKLLENYSIEKESNQNTNASLATIERGIEYIHKHFNDCITVDDVSAYSGYSKFHFCRCFKEITGHTVINYINMQKIKYAKNMLEKSSATVTEIAEMCGFNSATYFATVFKKYTGYSPSEVKIQDAESNETSSFQGRKTKQASLYPL